MEQTVTLVGLSQKCMAAGLNVDDATANRLCIADSASKKLEAVHFVRDLKRLPFRAMSASGLEMRT